MNIIKIKELHYKNTDVYFFPSIGSYLCFNTSDDAICLLNLNLEEVQKVHFSQLIYIYGIFIDPNKKRFVLYEPDEKLLLFCHVDSEKTHSIHLPQEITALPLIYHWVDDMLILSTYGEKFIIASEKQNAAEIIEEIDRKDLSQFYKFSKYVKNYSRRFQVDSTNQTFIEAGNNFIQFHIPKSNEIITIPEPKNDYHDVIFADGFFVIIAESEVIIKTICESFTILSKNQECFLRGAFIKTENSLFLYLLSGDRRSQYLSTITQYELKI